MNSEPVTIHGSRHHIRNHIRNLHRGLPYKKLRYQRKSAVQVIPHFFLTYENFFETDRTGARNSHFLMKVR
jgi:hypothetical protein